MKNSDKPFYLAYEPKQNKKYHHLSRQYQNKAQSTLYIYNHVQLHTKQRNKYYTNYIDISYI